MAKQRTILVVGLIADDDTATTFRPPAAFDDFEDRTVYEVIARLRSGKFLPDLVMTAVRTSDELLRLSKIADKRGVRLAVVTDERTRRQPQSVEELLALF